MAFSDKLTVVIDFVTGPATSGLGKLRSEVGKAEGAFGKMRAAGSVAFDSVKANAGEFALAAGTALVAFGAKAVGEFQKTALAAGQFSEAAGVSVEEASRLIEVAGDLGVSADAVQGSMMRLNKSLGANETALAEFGVEVVRAKDGTIDANATFIEAVTTIGKIEDPTKRAEAAQKAFGRSYGEVAELMGMSADELRKRLDSVSEAKVINRDELEAARDYRDAVANLQDVVEDLTVKLGQHLVPGLTRSAEAMLSVVDAASAVNEKVGDLTGKGLDGWAAKLSSPFGVAGSALDGLTDAMGTNLSATEALGFAFDHLTGKTEDGAGKIGNAITRMTVTDPVRKLGRELREGLTAELGTVRDATIDAKDAAEDLEAAWARLKGEVDERQAFLSVQDTFDDLRAKGEEALAAVQSGAADADQAMRDYEASVLRAQEETIQIGQDIGMLPDDVEVLLELIENGKIDEVERRLEVLTRNRTINLDIITRGGAGYGDRFGGPRATGGPVKAGTPYLVGERGPEIVVPGQNGTVIPNHRIGSSGGSAVGPAATYSITVNAGMGADGGEIGKQVVKVIKDYEARSGKGWRS